MSFVIAILIFIAALVAAAGLLAFRGRPWIGGLAGALTLAALLFWCLRPVCQAIPEDDLTNFDPPIETRTDTGMIGQRLFRQQDGRWLHCKTWVARQFFF